MEIKVTSKYLRVSPRKLRLVVNSVRGKNAIVAKNILSFQPNKGSKMLLSLLNNALAVAKGSEIDGENLVIASIACGDGPRLKRGKPASKGSMMAITKRQSHLNLVLSDKIKEVSKKVEKSEKPQPKANQPKVEKKVTNKVHPVKSIEDGLQEAKFNRVKEENGTKG